MDRGPTNIFKTVADVSVDNIFFSHCVLSALMFLLGIPLLITPSPLVNN